MRSSTSATTKIAARRVESAGRSITAEETDMLPDDFRRLALALPETEEREHQDHPDFRVGGKVFASLGQDGEWAMLKLAPEAQAKCVEKHPELFEPFAGAWGKQGCTRVWLAKAKDADLVKLVDSAWRRTAPKRLLRDD